MEEILLIAIRFVAIWAIGAPIVTLLHELGHASAALLLTDGTARVWTGTRNRDPRFRIGRLRVSITPRPGFTGFYSFDAPAHSRLAQALNILTGPLLSLLITIVAFGSGFVGQIADTWLGETLVVVLGFAAAWQLLVTAIPMRYPAGWGEYAGVASDGLRLAHLFRSRSSA